MPNVYQRNGTWYVDTRDAATGRRMRKATTAKSKGAALALLAELEAEVAAGYERQQLGLEPKATDGGRTLAELCEWWLASRCPEASRDRETSQLNTLVLSAPLGKLPLRAVTGAALESRFLEMEREGYAAGSVNKLRSILHAVYARGRKAGLWSGLNPVELTEHRKVPRRIYDTLTLEESARLLPKVPAVWRGFFAVSLYAGLRKGECAGLRKSDVDLGRGTLTVRASYDRETTKGGHADVIPLPEPLRPYVEAGLETPGPYLFPAADGEMHPEKSNPQLVLRSALSAAELVTGYEHRCRRLHCGHKEAHPDAAPRNCPACKMRLWPVPLPRPLRFHDLRHSCATILLRAGVDVHRVQRILRHASVTTTAGTYAHLAVEDLREGMEFRLRGAFRVQRGRARGPAVGTKRAHAAARDPRALEAAGRNRRASRGFSGWAERVSNPRQSPCKGDALPLSYPPGPAKLVQIQ